MVWPGILFIRKEVVFTASEQHDTEGAAATGNAVLTLPKIYTSKVCVTAG